MASKKLTTEQQELFDVLTGLQKRFVTHLLKGKNQTDAYKAAKGKAKTPEAIRNSASEIFTNLGVQAFLKSVEGSLIDDAIMSREEALKRLTSIARTSISDLAIFGTFIAGKDEEDKPIEQTVWRFKNSVDLTPEQMAAISELSAGKDGLKIKLHDTKAAIKQIAEMQGWEAPKKTEITGADGGPIEVKASELTDDELAAIISGNS